MHILFLATDELTRDPRSRRATDAAVAGGHTAVGLCLASGEPVPLKGIEIHRLGRTAPPRRFPMSAPLASSAVVRELRGCLRLGRWIVRTARLALGQTTSRIDVVHANDLETLPAGYLIAARRRARLVYDSHEIALDQEPGTAWIYRTIARTVESRLARRAPAVVTVSIPIADWLEASLRLPRRPYVVVNAPMLTALASSTFDAQDAPRLRAIYQGSMGPGRPLSDLFDAAEAMDESVELSIRVAGVDTDVLRVETRRRGLESKVVILEPVRPDQMIAGLAGYHVGVIINRPITRNDALVFPNKLFEYMMAGLAVVAPGVPGLAPTVEQERVGLLFTPSSPRSLAAVLTRLAADRPALEAMRRRARAAAVERYNAEAQWPILYEAWGV